MDDDRHDPLWDGSVYGALAGIPAVLLIAGGGTGPDEGDVPGTIVYGALLGGVIGFMVDAAF